MGGAAWYAGGASFAALQISHYFKFFFLLVHYSKRKAHKQQAWQVRQKRRDSLHATVVASHCLQTCLKRC